MNTQLVAATLMAAVDQSMCTLRPTSVPAYDSKSDGHYFELTADDGTIYTVLVFGE